MMDTESNSNDELNLRPGRDEKLSMEHFSYIFDKLYDARTKWFAIGLALNVDFNTLKSIERVQLSNQDTCLREMLAHRIQSGGPLTLNDLCRCLRRRTVGRSDLADKILNENKAPQSLIVSYPWPIPTSKASLRVLRSSSAKLSKHSAAATFQSPSLNVTMSREAYISDESSSPHQLIVSLPWPILASGPCPRVLESNSSSLQGVHDTALPPGKTIEGLEQESAAIEGKFAKLVASIYKSLTARSVSKDSLVSCLAGFKSRTKVFDADNPTVFRNEKSKFEDPSATLNTVWNVVADYFSFFDYEVLETIIIALGTDSDNKSIVKYKEDFEEYAKQRLIVLQKDTTVQNGEGRIEHSMIVKLDSSYDGCAIRSLKTLETKLSDILGLEKGVLKLRKVTDGCVQLVFTILDFIPCIIFPLSLDQESALGGLGVKQLDCEGYHFRANEDDAGSRGHDLDHESPPDSPPQGSGPLQLPVGQEDSYSKDTSLARGSLSDSDDGQDSIQSSLDSVAYPVVNEYVQTFGAQQLFSGQYKKQKRMFSDSGRGTLSQTVSRTTRAWLSKPGALTIRTQLTEVDCNIEDDDAPLEELRTVLGNFELSSNEPPPLRKISSSQLHSAVFHGELTNVRLLVEVFHCSPLAVNREGLTALHTAAACGELTILKYFIEDRLVNAATESVGQKTPLHCAAENGHLAVVKYLVGTQLVDPMSLNALLQSPLHSACLSGSLSTAQYLIQVCQQQPCYLYKRTAGGLSLLHYAALSGSPEVVHTLLTGRCSYKVNKEDINNTDMKGFTALIVAAQNGHLKIVEMLIASQANVNHQTNDNSTALHKASWQGHDEVVRVLLAAKATVNTQNKWGQSPLWSASFNDHQKCAELLIEAGANVDVPKENGFTALIVAAQNGHLKIVEMLIASQANVNHQTNDNETALEQASWKGHDEVVRVLLAAKATVNTQNKWGESPLLLASFDGHQKCAELLIEAGANVDVPREDGSTALIVTAQNGHLKIVEMLIASKANVDHQANFNMTPLMCAAYNGHGSIVELLLSKGADPNLRNNNGRTAYDLARENGHEQICEQL